MRPMALNVPVAMLMSMVVAFTVTPWLSYHVLKGEYGKDEEAVRDRTQPDVSHLPGDRCAVRRTVALLAWLLMLAVVVLFVLSSLLAATGRVPLKMLPFDNKNEFQIVVDMPEGTTVETTDEVLRALADRLREAAGGDAGADVCRHRFADRLQRHGATLLPDAGTPRRRHPRQSAAQGRAGAAEPRDPAAAAQRTAERSRATTDANIKLVEVPPGPPVIATLTAEVYGGPVSPSTSCRPVPNMYASCWKAKPVWSMSTTPSKTTRRSWFSCRTRKRPRCTASARQTDRLDRSAGARRPHAGRGDDDDRRTGRAALRRELNPLRIVLQRARCAIAPARSTWSG